jgi:hypothetical protein
MLVSSTGGRGRLLALLAVASALFSLASASESDHKVRAPATAASLSLSLSLSLLHLDPAPGGTASRPAGSGPPLLSDLVLLRRLSLGVFLVRGAA